MHQEGGRVEDFFFNKNSPGEGSWVHIQAIFLNQRKAFPFLIIFVIKKDIHSLFCLNMEWRWLYLYLDGDSKARGDRLPTSQVVVFLHLATILYWSWSPKKSSSSTWAEFNDWLLSSSSSRNLAFFCLFSLTLNKTGSVLIITTCNSRLSP